MLRGAQVSVAQTAADIAAVRGLWRQYWDSLGLTDEFQGFAEELRNLPGKYAPPGGTLLLAHDLAQPNGAAVGTAALRPLTDTACEAKRFYVLPQHRGKGIGKALLQRLLDEAYSVGYREIFCDTLPQLAEARSLYESSGFQETAPYSDDPTPGVIYFRRSLIC